jgi:hypothetical protein
VKIVQAVNIAQSKFAKMPVGSGDLGIARTFTNETSIDGDEAMQAIYGWIAAIVPGAAPHEEVMIKIALALALLAGYEMACDEQA